MISRRTRVWAGRIVEDEAGRVVLIEQGLAIFRQELAFLVGGERLGILVGGDEVVIARQEIAAARHPLDRLVLPQCTIGRVGVDIELGRQPLQVEFGRQFAHIRAHAVIP